ncbi:uncharacterized protein IUM83_15847 [Phytophthora cinnamomi]|uniref:uncharacterized protein n=1 Tax=Phytophthora cinnamomi TaxID=4785 RepID=UPI003559536F|nr:hypothetical protein IUM83_15847 [Phytophthora cinnamomi]
MAQEKIRWGKSCQDLENLELAKAYVHVSTDASVGITQSAETFWTHIKDEMESSGIANAIAKGDLKPRAWTSLQARFGVMQRSIGKYISCVTLVDALRESGSSERDMMKKALSMYQERHNKAFTFLEPYEVLAKYPKFQASIKNRKKSPRNKNRTATEGTLETRSSDSIPVVPAQIDTTEEKRPPKGVKDAKRAKLELSMEHRTVVAQETFSRLMTLKVEVLKEQIRVNQAQQRLA